MVWLFLLVATCALLFVPPREEVRVPMALGDYFCAFMCLAFMATWKELRYDRINQTLSCIEYGYLKGIIRREWRAQDNGSLSFEVRARGVNKKSCTIEVALKPIGSVFRMAQHGSV